MLVAGREEDAIAGFGSVGHDEVKICAQLRPEVQDVVPLDVVLRGAERHQTLVLHLVSTDRGACASVFMCTCVCVCVRACVRVSRVGGVLRDEEGRFDVRVLERRAEAHEL